MRIRFFVTILTVLIIVSSAVIFLYGYFLKKERLAFIDQQVRETASALFDSELGDLRNFNFEHADDIISEELGESRIGKFFIVRNSKGDILFESSSANLLPLQEIPRNQRWVTLHTSENYIRVLNLDLPRINDRTLQVGIVVSSEIIQPLYLSRSSMILLLSVLSVGLFASLFLTSFLLRPVARLSEFIAGASENLRSDQVLANVPKNLSRETKLPFVKINDEYLKLIAGLNHFIERINRYNRSSKLWAYQMAHELKTPLTLINLESESLLNANTPMDQGTRIHSIQDELNKVSETIGSFLSWAELENSTGSKHLFAVKLVSLIKTNSQRLDPENKLIKFEFENDLTVLCTPAHLEQLVLNLLTNALKYSPRSPVQVRISDHTLTIQDQGPGVPSSVLERLGEPFNKGSDVEGSGLGLAWVNSICKLYGWEFKIKSSQEGTTAQVVFNNAN